MPHTKMPPRVRTMVIIINMITRNYVLTLFDFVALKIIKKKNRHLLIVINVYTGTKTDRVRYYIIINKAEEYRFVCTLQFY